ncbi:MAG: DNA-processing protein DprA [Anaerolineae bacterium]|nr:DNA-processing protein DprA [Anaerolineae bacterium]
MALPNLMDIKGIGKKRYAIINTKMTENNWSLNDVYAMSPDTIKKIFKLPINVAKAISETGKKAVAERKQSKPDKVVQPKTTTDKLSEKDTQVFDKKDSNYPNRLKQILGDAAPEKLYIWGNLELIDKPSIGFCGSRNVSDKGLAVTADVAQQIAELGWVVVSGHARGVDATAHRVALENNAGTIIVLPQGINGFKLRSELRRYAKKENLLIISEFPLNARWNVGYAMQRNRTIIGLSDAMVLVESRTKGGTFNAGKTALQYQHPLFVVTFDDKKPSNAGNDYFIQRGATRLMKSQTTGRANITTLRQQVESQQARDNLPSAKPTQMTLLLESE